ncbi:glycerophosphodiester phosphodiesterase family protein [Sunxiuqinia sp. sy24]|uniref:glycerophosphodiester phosphodiesterase family protein n=1 Tax=Sunxiuqinia sp. sy24 TaxID=3461495 RepID=UPI00404524CF
MKLLYFLILFPLSIIGFAQTEQSPVEFPDCQFTAVAHRGYSEFYPENTLLAIEEAFKRGIKYCEVDVAISSDEVYVLHHDPYTIQRTTNGAGLVEENSWAKLSALDAGDWKARFFDGESLPSLAEALKLAQQYDACLYLDVKDFDSEILARTLDETGVDPDRMMPAITRLESAIRFQQDCPESPWVWFGADPEDPNDKNWFEERVALGCRVFELSDDALLEDLEWTSAFINQAHASGAKVWAYTVNNEYLIKELADLGVDGVETDRPYVAQLYVCGFDPVSTYPKQETNGNWDFKKKNFENTGVGSRLKNLVSDEAQLQAVEFGLTSQFGIAPVEGKDTVVAKIPAYNPANGLFAYDNFMMEDSGAVDFSFTVLMDIYIESKDSGEYISLIQTSPDNLNDADFFIAPDASVGTYGEYHGEFTFNKWHRVAFVHDGHLLRKYLDGEHLGDVQVEGSRWTLFNNMAYHGKHGLLFFADNDSETAEVYVHALQLRNYTMDPAEIALLGGVNAKGIPVNNKKVFSTGIADLELELVDWEQQTIFIKQAPGVKASAIPYDLKLSYGATTDMPQSGVFDFRDGELRFQVTAADGSSTNWTIQRQLSVGTNDLSDKPNVQVYPNPFSHTLKVKLERDAHFDLVNMMGQVLYRKNLMEGENRLNIGDLPTGTYLYKVRSEEGYSMNGVLLKSN